MNLRPRLVPVLDLCEEITRRMQQIEVELKVLAETQPVVKRFTEIPGVGPIIALSFFTAIENPKRFSRVEDVGAYFGLTPRVYQSGETQTIGKISCRGNQMTRTHLVQAANVLLTHTHSFSSLKAWGMKLSRKVGYNRAKVAVARKLAIIMLSMWKEDLPFYFNNERLAEYKAIRTTATPASPK